MLPYFRSVHVTASLYGTVFLIPRIFRLYGSFHSPPMLSSCVPAVLISTSTGMSTCCPSATLFSLTLGPDFPRADQLYSGNLGYSAVRILTLLSLLIPAFSLPCAPPLLTVWLRRACNAPLPTRLSTVPRLRCRVSAPEIFGAGPLDQ